MGKWQPVEISARLQHTRQLVSGAWVPVIGGVYAVLGALTWVRDNLLSSESRVGWDTWKLLPHWPLSWWLVGALGIILLGVVDGSFRLNQKLRNELKEPQERVPRGKRGAGGNLGSPAGLTRTTPLLDSPTYARSVVVLPAPKGDDRIFLAKGPPELVAPLHGLTDYMGQKRVADDLTKWVHWLVPVNAVSLADEDPWISAVVAGNTQVMMVYMIFEPAQRDRVTQLEKGTLIEIEGSICLIHKPEVTLRDCRLLKVRPRGRTFS